MKKILSAFFVLSLFVFTSCDRSGSTWENVKTAGRYIHRGFDSLLGKDYNSYWVQNEDEFVGPEDEFIPLNSKDLKGSIATAHGQPKDLQDSGLPGFSSFKLPDNLSSTFKVIHFDTDEHIIREKEDMMTVQKVATYLKKHPKTYLCISGHCDERASAAYNMSLGTRRANSVRVLLIKQGVDFNKIYTVSYGKERPFASGHSPQDWRENRRCEFTIYEKK
ncbi:MAG: OmpA family protein [Parachlamydiales bacterium]|jgi:peptidoglycan-associated lipoprotein